MTIEDLKQQCRWVLWRLEMIRNGRGELAPTKVPYQMNGKHASSTDPDTWSTYAEVMQFVGSYSGVGVMMSNGLGCTDLDHCVDPSTGKIAPWAREIIISLDTYAEFSPSRTGVHLIGEDIKLPGKGRKRAYETGAVEIYDTARFLTFTGHHLPKTPSDVLSRQDAFNALYERVTQPRTSLTVSIPISQEEKFHKLMKGDWQALGYPSQSEAVFALCHLLNLKFQNDAERVGEEFKKSGLYSDKWIEKWERLGPETIRKTRNPDKPEPAKYFVEQFSTIQPEEIDWIFESYVARGKITGLSGEPGAAKSLISLDWAARYSTGRGWPNGNGPKGKVLIFATEDGAADTILPRFLSAGGDPNNLLHIRLDGDHGFYFDDPQHLDILRRVTEQYQEIGMVIVDPILEHIRVNREQTTREAYAPLRVLIAERGIALVQIVHTNKRGADTLGSVGDKVGGVKALVGLPRFVYSVHKTEDEIHHICRIKQNVGRNSAGSVDFRILERNKQPVIEWLGRGTATAQDALTVKKDPDCADRLISLLQEGDNDSDIVRAQLIDGYRFTINQTRNAVTKLRAEGKLDVRKLANGKTVWRRVGPNAQPARPDEIEAHRLIG